MEVIPYNSERKTDWDNFILQSKNGTFLFYRDFMEYHQDRFTDFSLMVYEKKKLLAVLPANRVEDKLFSHQGLTYGGIVFKDFAKVKQIKKIFEAVLSFLVKKDLKAFTLKLLPSKYNDFQSSALDYLLFQRRATLLRRDMNFFIPLQRNLKQHKNKKKLYNKDFVKDFSIRQENEFAVFWEKILQPVLQEKYNANPVHSVEEIELLAQRFPENIKQYNLYYKNELVAGMTLFIEQQLKVVKSQYGTVSEEGKKLKALDFLYLELIKKYKELGFAYFDLGITNEADGYSYNSGLTNYKEELGGIPTNQDQYQLIL